MTKKKDTKGFKVNKYYKDDSDMKSDKVTLSLDKLRYGLVTHGELVSISINNERLNINGSWIGLLLLMIETYYYNKLPLIKVQRFNFIVELVQNNVITNGLDITSTYGTYDSDTPYVAYKILNTPYWLETNNSTESIFNALVKLAKLLDMKYNTVELSVVKKEIKDSADGIKDYELQVIEEWAGIDKIDTELKSSLKVSKVNILGEVVNVTSVFDIIIKLTDLLFKVYGIGALEYVVGNEGTGVTGNKDLPGYTINVIENLDYSELVTGKDEITDKDKLILYTNNSINSQLEFLKDICDNLEVTGEDIKIAFIKMVAKEKKGR